MSKFTKMCFVIAPLGDAGSSIRIHSDQVLRYIIQPAVGRCGLQAVRADEIEKAGQISSQVLEHLQAAPVAVADLTGTNPNVMYELAFRHARCLPVVQIASSDTHLPFDIAGQRTIFFSIQDPDSIAKACAAVASQAANALADPSAFTSPLGVPALGSGPLSDEQTRNLVLLHQGNAAHRIYSVIDDTLTQMEANPASFNEEVFFERVLNALLESRKLCAPFTSHKLGSLYEFYRQHYAPEELRDKDEVKRFLKVWNDVLRKVPPPNAKQKPE